MMFVVAHQHKQEAFIAGTILIVAIALGFLFFVNDAVRFKVYDAYNSVFKLVITDRVLREDALVYSNLPYCNTDNPRQTLDLYIPKDPPATPAKLVIFIHGGGWRSGDKSSQIMTYYSESLLEQGIAVASVNYRLYPEVTYPGPNDDIACAVEYLSSIATDYGISPDKWTLFGDSAGAQLGAYAMSDARINGPFSLFVGFYGPYDLVAQTARQDLDADRYTNDGTDSAQASPVFRAGKQGATYLLYHGQKDRIVSLAQSEQFADKLTAEQINVKLTTVKNAGHYFSPRSDPPANKVKQIIVEHILRLQN